MRVLVFGASGQVARGLSRASWAPGTNLVQLDRAAADFSRPETLGEIVRRHRPDAVVIAAAYTQVDKAESEEPLAATVNSAAPEAIAREAAALSIPVVHISTDYVFDGEKDRPYVEDDPVAPIGAYGRTKLAGEIGVREANPQHLILRTSWVYDAQGTNFVRTMLRLAESLDEVRVVADQHGCPTAAPDIADAIARVLPVAIADKTKFGTYHMPGATGTTWNGFAEAVFANLAARGMKRPRNVAIATTEYPTPARRPMNSCLSGDAFARAFGFRLRGFEAALPAILDEALGTEPIRKNVA
jgi:dTDP-4-dehydrorhamnose reductase